MCRALFRIASSRRGDGPEGGYYSLMSPNMRRGFGPPSPTRVSQCRQRGSPHPPPQTTARAAALPAWRGATPAVNCLATLAGLAPFGAIDRSPCTRPPPPGHGIAPAVKRRRDTARWSCGGGIHIMPSANIMARPIISGICGTTAFPQDPIRSSRLGTPCVFRLLPAELVLEISPATSAQSRRSKASRPTIGGGAVPSPCL